MTGKNLTNPTSPKPATIDREAIKKENRDLARDMWQGKLSPRERQALNNLTIQYGLDPLQKQLLCLGGNFYVTVGGLKVIADHSDNPPDAIQLQPATMEERNGAGITANDPAKPGFVHFWKALLYKGGNSTPYVEFGEATAKDVGIQGKGGSPAREKDIRAVARTRATGRVLRNAYSIGLPLAEDAPVDITIIDGEVIKEAEEKKPAAAPDTEKPVTQAQIKKIHVSKIKAIEAGAINEEDYYTVLSEYEAKHSSELTLNQARDFIDRLDKKIADSEPPEETEQPEDLGPEEFFNERD